MAHNSSSLSSKHKSNFAPSCIYHWWSQRLLRIPIQMIFSRACNASELNWIVSPLAFYSILFPFSSASNITSKTFGTLCLSTKQSGISWLLVLSSLLNLLFIDFTLQFLKMNWTASFLKQFTLFTYHWYAHNIFTSHIFQNSHLTPLEYFN